MHFGNYRGLHLLLLISDFHIFRNGGYGIIPIHRSKQFDTQYNIDYRKDIIKFGRKVRARREAQNISLDDLANQINSDKASLSRIENGERIPRLDKVLRIADALHTTPAKLLPSRYLDEGTANILPQIYERLMRQSVEQRRMSIRYICAMLDGLAFSNDQNP